jgi:hypothetical protein
MHHGLKGLFPVEHGMVPGTSITRYMMLCKEQGCFDAAMKYKKRIPLDQTSK